VNIPADWTFERPDVADAFDRHVREQLPWYDLATGMVAHVVRHYLPHGGRMYDLGAATGNIGRSLGDTLKQRQATLVAVDDSAAMVDVYDGPGTAVCADITDIVFEPFDVAVAFLTLCFVPVADRAALVRRLQDSTRPGGAVIIVDKFTAPAGYMGTVLHRLTIAGKAATGTPAEDIVAKELSLSGIQRPLTEAPGFEVFRFGEFAAYVWEG
jgi:tRNA (cmo5U34)-methyltransferase